MRKMVVLLIFSGLVLPVVSQQYVPTVDDLERFLKTKTLVVLDRNPLNTYDAEIREAMESEWNITEFEFISFNEFEGKRKDPNYSFLYMTNVIFEKDKLRANYKFLSLSLGGDYYNINQMPDIVSLPVSYKNVEEDSYNYKLGMLVRFIQSHINLIYNNPQLISNNIFKHYNDNMGDIQGKVLYLVENEMAKDINSPSRIKKIYPYEFKMVTREDVKEAIMNRDENVVFLHKVGPEGTRINARCYKILMGASDAKFYYFDYHMISDKKPDGLLMSDLKKLAK